MFNIEQHEMQEILTQLDQAIDNHTEWFDSITRTLVCRLPHDHRDAVVDAHRQCRLGQWYYGAAPEALRRHPGFIALEAEHSNMHRLAANLLQTAASGSAVSPLDFDSFANALGRLRLQLYTLKRELEDLLFNRDALTGANSRIGMLTKLREQHELVKRQVQACCIVMMDVDHFKVVNDTYGHLAGDRALAVSVRYVMAHLRPYDKLFRYGGEEFLACMPNTNTTTGHEVMERVREGLAATAIDYDGKAVFQITMSFGLALLDPDVSVEQSIDRSDKAMYAAKTAGRNCSRIWDPSM
ncbi:MAG: diguanylate cyclase [Thiobacillus sp.]|nr:diguanylate cyclase [Thiobacillus sp.]